MVSPRKYKSAISPFSHGRPREMPASSKSCDSLFSGSSPKGSPGTARVLYNRRAYPGKMNYSHVNTSSRQSSIIPATQEVRQRVLSARRLRIKTYQNQLAEAHQHITELLHENRFLRSLHKRQDSALAKYEKNNAELPKLLHSHDEELRVCQAKHRNAQNLVRELEQKLKQKESIILTLSDQNKYFSQLNRDKNLDERQKLTDKLRSLETQLEEKENEMKLLSRKMQLEKKNFRQQLHLEQKKTRDILVKLEQTRMELSGYRKINEIQISDIKQFKPIDMPPTGKSKTSSAKLEPKPEEKSDYEQPTTDTDNQISQRSFDNPFSTRTVRKINISSGIVEKTSAGKAATPTTFKKRFDLGADGDAKAINGVKKSSSQVAQKQQKQTNLVQAAIHTKKKNLQQNKIEHSQLQDILGDIPSDDPSSQMLEDEEPSTDDYDLDDESDAKTEEHIGRKNEESDLTDVQTDNQEDPDSTELDESALVNTSTRIKKNMCNIRKQLTDDYKEREAFLDNFCRQSNNVSAPPQEVEKPPEPKARIQKLGGNRKSDLLATLK